MKFLFAPDSFKGSLSSSEMISILEREAKRAFPSCTCVGIPMADGGEGTMEALAAALHGAYVPVRVRGPLFEPVDSRFASLSADTAVLEMAAASGLPLVPAQLRNPENTTTYGTGELVRAALEAGHRHIVIGIGGSATNDCGIGALAALGVRFLDADGRELSPVGGNLALVAAIDRSGLHPAAANARFTAMCDIDNPLLGPHGATYVYGPQKGASAEQLVRLEAGMAHFAQVLEAACGVSVANKRGAGAAGGLAAGLCACLGAELRSGIDTVLALTHFDALLRDVDLVVTGEGRIDGQSACGKVLSGIGGACRLRGVPAAAIAGSMGEQAEDVYACGIDTIITTVNAPMNLESAMHNASALYASAARRLFGAIRAGMQISERKPHVPGEPAAESPLNNTDKK